jgi:hypothetical protein
MPLQNVHIRINDAATGQPTPVRLRVTDAAGNYFAPFGHAAEFPTGRGEAVGGDVVLNGERWAYIDGTCEIAVPSGELMIQAAKGPEFRSLRETINLPLGKMSLRFAIERLTNLQEDGWYAGDTRAHFLSPHAALLEAAAEDLAIVHVLAGATPMLASDGCSYVTYPNLEAFSGQSAALERDGHSIVVGTHNKHPVLGELALLHCHRVVYPLAFGGADATDDWSLGDWCDQCHRKRGLVVWTKAERLPFKYANEAFAHAVLGHFDAVELSPDWAESLAIWHLLLRAGVRIPLAGASAKSSNRLPLGACRTFAKLGAGETMNPGSWIEGVRSGRTVVSCGAFLRLEADGVGPGETLERRLGSTIRVAAAMDGSDRLPADVMFNGKIIGQGSFDYVAESSGWLAACHLEKPIAHTSPIWISVPDHPQPKDAAAVRLISGHLERGREWVEREGRFEQPRFRSQLVATFDAAIRKLN